MSTKTARQTKSQPGHGCCGAEQADQGANDSRKGCPCEPKKCAPLLGILLVAVAVPVLLKLIKSSPPRAAAREGAESAEQ